MTMHCCESVKNLIREIFPVPLEIGLLKRDAARVLLFLLLLLLLRLLPPLISGRGVCMLIILNHGTFVLPRKIICQLLS